MHATHSRQGHQAHVSFCDAKIKVLGTVQQKRAPETDTNGEACPIVISCFRTTEAIVLTSVQGGVVRDPV